MKGILKGLILNSLVKGAKTSKEIFTDISSCEYELNMGNGKKQKFTYDGTLNNVRVDILYLRTRKLIKIINDVNPYSYSITNAGIQGAKNPFKYLEWLENEVKKQTAEIRAEIRLRREELEKEYKSKKDKLNSEVESRVNAEIEVKMEKIAELSTTLIKERGVEMSDKILKSDLKFNAAVKDRVWDIISKKPLPSGTKIMIGKDNVIEINTTTDPKYQHPYLLTVENGKLKDISVKN